LFIVFIEEVMEKYKSLFSIVRLFTGRAAKLKAFPSPTSQIDFDESLIALIEEGRKLIENKD
jgi:DNA-directed RNA polymerase subunit K/omega